MHKNISSAKANATRTTRLRRSVIKIEGPRELKNKFPTTYLLPKDHENIPCLKFWDSLEVS